MVFLIILILIMIIMAVLIFIFFIMRKSWDKKRYTTEEYIPKKQNGWFMHERYFTIETINMKIMLFPLILSFIIMTLFMGAIILAESEMAVLSDIGKIIMDDYVIWLIQFIFIQMAFFMLLALYKRIKLTVENGILYINGTIQDIRYYQIKKIFAQNSLLYLKTDRKLWILLPTTVEELSKYKREDILKKQTEELNNNIEQIEKILSSSDAEYKKFSTIRNMLFGFGGMYILSAVISMGILISKYY